MELDAQVGVVGVGTMGSMALWQLARRGIPAIGFEQFRVGHELGAGVGEARQFRANYLEDDVREIMTHAENEYRELEEESGLSLLTLTGGLTIGAEDSPVIRELTSRMAAAGDDARFLGRSEMHDRYPQHVLREDDVVLWNDRSGFIRPEISVAAASTTARAMGAEIVEGCAITELEPHDDHVVIRSEGGSWRVRRAIVTAGPWIWRLLPRTLVPGGDLGRLLLTWFPTRDDAAFSPDRYPTFTRDIDGVVIYGLPSLWSSTARVGFAGPRSRFADPDILERSIVPRHEIDAIQRLVADLIPGLVPTVVRTGTHLDAYTPDGQPLIGPIDDGGRIFVAAGFSGRGFKMAPVIGRILAELGADGTSEIDISRWRPSRFSLPARN
ncbi:FAD-dependent oxidoreductase [Leifsonia sp. NPDC058230]|uniref:FAD-dependent oxidoreductase n=1 Tax=Leifsonia sp. NPDC058230 TaxID=3346391 RepID=UPI0036DBA53A